jgi:hypothetical protein
MSGGGGTAGGRGEVSSSRGWGEADCTQGERIWSSLVRQKVERGLLLLIPILWFCYTTTHEYRSPMDEDYNMKDDKCEKSENRGSMLAMMVQKRGQVRPFFTPQAAAAAGRG